MAAGPNANQENPDKKPSVSEAIESMIDQKKNQTETQEAPQVQEAASATQEGVAEVMAGVDKPKEKISERAGESGKKGDIKTSTGQAGDEDEEAIIRSQIASGAIPPPEVMIRKVRTAIKQDIANELKKAKKLRKNLATGSAQEYNASIARVRQLKQVLASLFTATVDTLKNIYTKYFRTDGHRRQEEL